MSDEFDEQINKMQAHVRSLLTCEECRKAGIDICGTDEDLALAAHEAGWRYWEGVIVCPKCMEDK